MSVLDTLRAATPASKSVKMCVDGALQAEWDKTWAELDEVDTETDNGSLAKPQAVAIADRLDVLRDQVQASEVTFSFVKMDWTVKVALQSEHPPREKNLPDRLRGFNTDTYYPALIRGSVASVTGADGETVTKIPDDVWTSLLGRPATEDEPAVSGSLNVGQINRLISAANYVNDGETAVPPSARSLLESQDFGASLAQPSPGTSPQDGSEDGSRLGSASTSTTKKGASAAS